MTQRPFESNTDRDWSVEKNGRSVVLEICEWDCLWKATVTGDLDSPGR